MASPLARLIATTVALSLFPFGSPAQATPDDVEADAAGSATTCYGGAVRSYFETGGWGGEAGTYRTSTRCRDINVRNASDFDTKACVVFVDKTNSCNHWTDLPARSGFRTVATNVRDGVNFRVRFANLRYEHEPLVAYHAF